MRQNYDQQVNQDIDNYKVVAFPQVRDGKTEWISPVSLWEKSNVSGLYFPPGAIPDTETLKPRVRAEVIPPQKKSIGFEQISISLLTQLSSAIYGNAIYARIEIRGAQVSFRTDGGVPTSAIGHYLNHGDVLYLESKEDITNFYVINVNTPATLVATYFEGC